MAENHNNIHWIALDAMGGDYAPAEIVKGALIAASRGVHTILVGDEKQIRAELGNSFGKHLRIIHTSEKIEMTDSPVRAMKSKPDNSLSKSIELARDKEASAVLSAGNSGALLVGAKWILGDVPGVFRPAIATPIPTPIGDAMLLDAGVSTDCSPENLFQFALMGHFYVKNILKRESPRIALLNIGEEKSKGNVTVQKVYEFLSESNLNFVGNIEGDEIFSGSADVIVCDGFVGNIVLKVAEGTGRAIMEMIKENVSKGGFKEKIGSLMLRDSMKSIKRKMDWREYGGALIMGVRGNVIITHGKSKAPSIANALVYADSLAKTDLAEMISNEITSNAN